MLSEVRREHFLTKISYDMENMLSKVNQILLKKCQRQSITGAGGNIASWSSPRIRYCRRLFFFVTDLLITCSYV